MLALLALTACSGTGNWARAGADDEQIKRDYAACQRQASAEMSTAYNIDHDILSTRRQDWQRSGTLGQRMETLRAQERPRAAEIAAQCMQSKGYSQPN